jgi:para-aminobenzoate synthetase component I
MAGMALIQLKLPYHEGAYWLTQVRHLLWPMLLESGRVDTVEKQFSVDEEISLGARFDIVVAEPVARIIHRRPVTEVHVKHALQQYEEDPLAVIKRFLAPHKVDRVTDVPFAGGALGYFSYDLGRSIEPMPELAAQDMPLPELLVGIYDWAIVVDHHKRCCQLVSHARFNTADSLHALQLSLLQPKEQPEKQAFSVVGDIAHNMDKPAYAKAFRKVKDYILAGDCYQINLAQRLAVKVQGDAWQAYDQFRQLSKAPFMAYLQVDDGQGMPFEVLSMSPERFLQVTDNKVETRPIKGTRPRHADAAMDKQEAESLAGSIKDRAENLMIVDLLRNDIGKVCEIGSVKVDALFRLQRFTNVHHLVSIVRGVLASGYHAMDLLRGCFPGGSITGAPKLRAMEIIEELEPHRRGIYCGSIGYVGFDGSMDTNISIRTAVICNQTMTFYAGGGVVADSDCDKEYQETLDKASQFLKLVAQFKTHS